MITIAAKRSSVAFPIKYRSTAMASRSLLPRVTLRCQYIFRMLHSARPWGPCYSKVNYVFANCRILASGNSPFGKTARCDSDYSSNCKSYASPSALPFQGDANPIARWTCIRSARCQWRIPIGEIARSIDHLRSRPMCRSDSPHSHLPA